MNNGIKQNLERKPMKPKSTKWLDVDAHAIEEGGAIKLHANVEVELNKI